MLGKWETITFRGDIRAKTKLAWLIAPSNDRLFNAMTVWFPKSQIKILIKHAAGDFTFGVPLWLAQAKGFKCVRGTDHEVAEYIKGLFRR